MASICVGDWLFDESGEPCQVTWKSEPHIDILGTFLITFDDGSEIVCGGGHEWLTFTSAERRRLIKHSLQGRAARRLKRPSKSKFKWPKERLQRVSGMMPEVGKIRTTTEILGSLKEFKFTSYPEGETNHAIPLARCWKIEDAALPIDPYVFGAWLGDGTATNGHITGLDEEVYAEICKAGYLVVTLPSCGKTRNIVGLHTQLKSIGVIKNKHIPEEYLWASSAQRLALLQGLMDTDGYVGKTGHVEFCNTNINVANGVFHLACSLGLKPSFSEGRATLYGKDCGPKYRVCWTATLPVFRLKRKLDRLPSITRSTQNYRYIVSVERIEDEAMQCIEVNSPSHLYLAGKTGIPTHNSITGRWDAHMRALAYPGFKYCILRRTYPELLRSHLIDLPREMRLLGGDFLHTNKVARYPNGSLGFFSHCQNEQDVLNLLSAEFYLMVFDEVSTFEWEMFVKLAASVRVPVGSGLIAMVRAATNPLGVSAEMIDRYWVSKDVTLDEDSYYNPAEWYAIKANVEDNPYLDADQYKARFSGMPEHVRKAWVDGDFSLENAMFDLRPRKNGRPYHVINELDLPKVLKSAVVYRAIDAGWFPDPTVCLWIAHLGNRHIVFHEKIWYKTTAAQIAEEIKEEDKKLGITKVAMTFCDPSMDINTTADIRTIKETYEVHDVPMENSINDREKYATVLYNVLAEEAGDALPRIQFYVNPYNKAVGCPYLVRTIPQMRFHPKKEKYMDDHKHDHAVVACCYYLLSHSADLRNEIQFGKPLPKWMREKTRERIRGIV